MPTATSSASVVPDAPPAAAARRRAVSHEETPVSARIGDPRADQHERAAAERLRALGGQLEALERRVDGQERQQADRQRHHQPQPDRRDPPHPRQPQHPERDRDHADVDPQQREQPEERQPGLGRLDGGRDLVHDRRAGRGEQRDLVGLALHPGLLDPDLRRAEPPDRIVRPAELRERVVDDRLRDGHLVGPVVADGQLDHARLEHGPLDRELLRRRSRAGRRARARRARRTAPIASPISSSGTSPSTHNGADRTRCSSAVTRPRRSPASRAR